MVEFGAIMKGKVCKFKIEKKIIYMMSENTGGHLIKLGEPLELKKNALMPRKNKMPQMICDFIKAWKQEDIDNVAKMESDKEMLEDMKKDFKLMGYEILKENGI